MEKFNNVIQKYLKNHENHKKYVAVLLSLSMIITFIVPLGLTEKASSMTGALICGQSNHVHSEECYAVSCGMAETEEHTHTSSCYSVVCGSSEHIHNQYCYEEIMGDVIDIAEKDIDIHSSDDAVTYAGIIYEEDGAGETVTIKDVEVTFSSNETVKNLNGANLSDNNNTLTASANMGSYTSSNDRNVKFNLSYTVAPSNVSASQPYVYYQLPDNTRPTRIQYGPVYDNEYSAYEPSGYYYIDMDGFIKIRFTDNYISTKESEIATNGIVGKISFEGSVSRSSEDKADELVVIGGSTIPVTFPFNELSMTKNGTLNKAEHKITWTVEINSGNVGVKGKVLTDDMLKECENLSVKLSDNTTVNYTHTPGTNSLTINDEYRNNIITISYDTILTEAQVEEHKGKNISNSVKLTDIENPVTKNVYIDNNIISFNKTGVADYNIADVKDNGKIKWTIELTNEYGFALGKRTIFDEMFKDKSINDLDLKVNGKTVEAKDFDSKTGTLNLDTTETSVNITYIADAKHYANNDYNEVNKNEYKLDNGEIKKTNLTYYPFKISKNGVPNYSNASVEWTITIDKQDGNPSLKGYKIKDSVLDNIDTNKITILDNNNPVDFTKSGDTITINSDVQNITLKYSQYLTSDELKQSSVEKKNKAELDFPGGKEYQKTSEVIVTYTPQKKNNKTVVGSAQYEDVVYSGNGTKIVEWKISLGDDSGFAGKEVTDTMSVEASLSSNVTHTITDDQVNAIKVVLKNGSGETKEITNNNDFTVTKNENGTFTIKFSDNIDAEYRFAEITYSTTISNLDELGEEQKAIFKNKSDFGGNESEATYEFTRKGTKIVKRLKSNSSENGPVDNDTAHKKIEWEVNITPSQDYNSAVIDIMSSKDKDGNEINAHYIDNECEIRVIGIDNAGKETVLTKETDYAIKYNNSGESNRFEVSFKDTVTTNKYRSIRVEYETKADITKVPNGEKVSFNNGVKWGENGTSVDSDNSYEYTRTDVSIDKSRTNNPANEGEVDWNTENKVLEWKAVLRPGAKFDYTDKWYYDSMSSSVDGMHYITPAQIEKIKVFSTNADNADTDKTKVDTSNYEIHYYSDAEHKNEITNFTGNEKAISFGIKFKNNIDARFVVIEYATTADIKTNLAINETRTFSNSAEFNNKTDNGNDYSFTRKGEVLKKTKLTNDKSVEKTTVDTPETVDWQITLHPGIDGFKNVLTDALSSEKSPFYMTPEQQNSLIIKGIKFDETNEEITKDKFDIIFKTATFTEVQSGENATNFTIQVKSDALDEINGTYKEILIQYSTTAEVADAVTGEKMEYTNTAKYDKYEDSKTFTYECVPPPYAKDAIDNNGNLVGETRTPESVLKMKFNDNGVSDENGKDYYVFTWRIDVRLTGDDAKAVSNFVLTDTLPEGFVLCDEKWAKKEAKFDWDTNLNNSKNYYDSPIYIWNMWDNNIKDITPTTQGKSALYKTNSQNIEFYNIGTHNSSEFAEYHWIGSGFNPWNNSNYYICYSARISVEDFNRLYGDGQELLVTAVLVVSSQPPLRRRTGD